MTTLELKNEEDKKLDLVFTEIQRLRESIEELIYFLQKMDYSSAKGSYSLLEKQVKEMKIVVKDLEQIGCGEYK